MPRVLRNYVRVIESLNRRIGRLAMLLIFVMMAILLYSSISKSFFVPEQNGP